MEASYYSNDKEKLVLKVVITGMIFNVIFNFILIPKFSIEGAAFATTFTEILICLYRGYEVKKISRLYFFSKERLNYIGLGLGAFIRIFLLKNMGTENSLYNIIFFSLIYGVIYFGGLLLLEDKNILLFLSNTLIKLKTKKIRGS